METTTSILGTLFILNALPTAEATLGTHKLLHLTSSLLIMQIDQSEFLPPDPWRSHNLEQQQDLILPTHHRNLLQLHPVLFQAQSSSFIHSLTTTKNTFPRSKCIHNPQTCSIPPMLLQGCTLQRHFPAVPPKQLMQWKTRSMPKHPPQHQSCPQTSNK